MSGKSLKDLQPFEILRSPSRKVRYRYGALFFAIVLSAMVHFVSVNELASSSRSPLSGSRQKPVKVTINSVPKKKNTKENKTPKDDELLKKLLETPQEKTERPTESSYAGIVDHKTAKEMRLKDIPSEQKGLDAGQDSKNQKEKRKGVAHDQAVDSKKPKNLQDKKTKDTPNDPLNSAAVASKSPEFKGQFGKSSVVVPTRKPRNSYEALLPSGTTLDDEQRQAGYREYIDQSIAEGDKIDINTSEYRYIGYFTSLRKAIELVWNYPKEAARRGLQGEVGLEFAIEKDGRASQVKVLKSSGYEMLDRAIVEAIHLASPFSPLPDGFGKKKIVVTGSFRYVLYGYNVN